MQTVLHRIRHSPPPTRQPRPGPWAWALGLGTADCRGPSSRAFAHGNGALPFRVTNAPRRDASRDVCRHSRVTCTGRRHAVVTLRRAASQASWRIGPGMVNTPARDRTARRPTHTQTPTTTHTISAYHHRRRRRPRRRRLRAGTSGSSGRSSGWRWCCGRPWGRPRPGPTSWRRRARTWTRWWTSWLVRLARRGWGRWPALARRRCPRPRHTRRARHALRTRPTQAFMATRPDATSDNLWMESSNEVTRTRLLEALDGVRARRVCVCVFAGGSSSRSLRLRRRQVQQGVLRATGATHSTDPQCRPGRVPPRRHAPPLPRPCGTLRRGAE